MFLRNLTIEMWRRIPWLGQWILAHAGAFAIAAGLNFAIADKSDFSETLFVLLVSGLISGSCSGSVEAGLLTGIVRYPSWWLSATVLATPFGVALGALAAAFIYNAGFETSAILGVLIFGTPVGAVVGAVQWLFLRRLLHHARLWIVFAAIARGLGWVTGFLLADALNLQSMALAAAIGGSLGGAIYGIITGSCLMRLRSTD